jgi:hypothetical protein
LELVSCVSSYHARGMVDVSAWNALAQLHSLNEIDVEQLMSCTPAVIAHQWQLDAAANSIREARLECDHEQLAKALCVLLRAELLPSLCCGAVCVQVLTIALLCDHGATPDMAVAVRLARVLSCKLERVYSFSKCFKK